MMEIDILDRLEVRVLITQAIRRNERTKVVFDDERESAVYTYANEQIQLYDKLLKKFQ